MCVIDSSHGAPHRPSRRKTHGSWEQFDKQTLERYADWLQKIGRTDRTLHLELTLIKSVNAWLIQEGLLNANRKINYPLKRLKGTDAYCYASREVSAMVRHCLENPELVWLGRAILGLALLGVRIGELSSLRWSDVDLEANTILIADERSSSSKKKNDAPLTTKGKCSRTIPIHPQLRELLLGLPQTSDGLVFHPQKGGRLYINNVREIFIRCVIEPLKEQFPTRTDEIGFEDGRIHRFRHYFCSQSFVAGVPATEIQEWLGHADSKMVENYRHLGNEDAQRRIRLLPRIDDRIVEHQVCKIFTRNRRSQQIRQS